jgi:hypothetical protein
MYQSDLNNPKCIECTCIVPYIIYEYMIMGKMSGIERSEAAYCISSTDSN